MSLARRFDRRIFVDTSAFVMVSNAREARHEEAARLMRQFATDQRVLWTTTFVIAETHALALSRYGARFALHLLQTLDTPQLKIVRPKFQDEQRARDIIYRQTDKAYSLTDAISFAVMERLGITTAFAFDRHFSQYGLVMVPGNE